MTLQPASRGDTGSLNATLAETVETVLDVQDGGGDVALAEEAPLDKGYHSNDVCRDLKSMGIRAVIRSPAGDCSPGGGSFSIRRRELP